MYNKFNRTTDYQLGDTSSTIQFHLEVFIRVLFSAVASINHSVQIDKCSNSKEFKIMMQSIFVPFIFVIICVFHINDVELSCTGPVVTVLKDMVKRDRNNQTDKHSEDTDVIDYGKACRVSRYGEWTR